MDLDIRKNVIDKIKNDSTQDLINMLDESVVTSDELVLPGLGVMLELFWNDLSKEEKNNICKKIKANLNN